MNSITELTTALKNGVRTGKFGWMEEAAIKHALQTLGNVGQRVELALSSYRCQYVRDTDDDGLDLVDVLTPQGTEDIIDGKREMELLAEHITMTIIDDDWAGIAP